MKSKNLQHITPILFLVTGLLLLSCSDDPAESPDLQDTSEQEIFTDTNTDTEDPQIDEESEIRETHTQDTQPEVLVDECDPFLQDCTLENYQCDVRSGVSLCVASESEQYSEDEACIGNDCEAGLTCINWPMGTVCTAFCDQESGAGCSEDKYCGSRMSQAPDVGLCINRPVACDIFNDTCPEGEACGFSHDPDTGDPMLACILSGEQGTNEACQGDNGKCMRHHVCIRENEDQYFCRQVCQGNDDCPDESLCEGLSNTYDVPFCR